MLDVATLQALPADATVVEQRLPSENDWAEAHARAQALFGIGDVTELCTARNVGALADRVRRSVAAVQPSARELVTQLASRGPIVLGGDDVTTTPRYVLAETAAGPCDEPERDQGRRRSRRAARPLPAPRGGTAHRHDAVLRCRVVAASRRVDWNILATVASWGPEHQFGLRAIDLIRSLAEVWCENEFVKHLSSALTTADAGARQLVLEATRTPDPIAPSAARVPEDGQSMTGQRVVDADDLDAVTKEITALVRAGKRVRVTWQVVE